MFLDQNSSIEKHALYTSRPIPMHAACACPVHYSPASKKASYAQDLPSDDLNHDLDTSKYGPWNKGGYDSFSFWRWKTTLTKSH